MEYGLLLATIALLMLVSGAALGGWISQWFNKIIERVTTLPYIIEEIR